MLRNQQQKWMTMLHSNGNDENKQECFNGSKVQKQTPFPKPRKLNFHLAQKNQLDMALTGQLRVGDTSPLFWHFTLYKSMIKANAAIQLWEFVIKPFVSEACFSVWNFYFIKIGTVITSIHFLAEGKGAENQWVCKLRTNWASPNTAWNAAR